MKPTTRTAAWGTAAALYFVVTTLAHLEFSLWLVGTRTATWQGQTVQYSYRDAMPYLLPVAALALLAWLVRDALRHGTRPRIGIVAGYWLLWGACVAAVDRWLTYSVPEYFHYPQYALLTWLLAKALDPDRSRWPVGRLLALTILLGAIDELAQYLWITASYSHYYDFNDVLVNLLAAVLGVMVYYGFRVPPAQGRPRIGWHWHAGALALALGIGVAVGQARLQLTPPSPVPSGAIMKDRAGHATLYLQRQQGLYDRWHPAAWRPRHWVLGPLGGLELASLVWAAWLGYPLRRRRQ
ncbi:MAG: hypothetical protein Q8S02_07965 [Hydrogenophaga sp.]|nr:hypothetical protein [Hydrogenophaga sp.]